MSICTNCNGKGYNTVYKGEGGYTDFGPMKYIETTPMGTQKVPCSKCQVKEEIKEEIKETTGQTVYEQLQEIQDKIADKTLSWGCEIIRTNGIKETVVKFNAKLDGQFYLVTLCDNNNTHYGVSLSLSDVENIIIIGHPITLTYLLYHLGRSYIYESGEIIEQKKIGYIDEYDNIFRCDWVLTKKTNYFNRDAMLSDQSPETIKAIWEIICK